MRLLMKITIKRYTFYISELDNYSAFPFLLSDCGKHECLMIRDKENYFLTENWFLTDSGNTHN